MRSAPRLLGEGVADVFRRQERIARASPAAACRHRLALLQRCEATAPHRRGDIGAAILVFGRGRRRADAGQGQCQEGCSGCCGQCKKLLHLFLSVLAELLGKSRWDDGTPAAMGREKKQKNSTIYRGDAGNLVWRSSVIE